MNTTIKLLITSLALVACGDNKTRPDAARRADSAPPDAYCSNCPDAPALGTTQLDRMGRPAINTALNKAFTDTTPTSTGGAAAKDAYNAASDKTAWVATNVGEFAKNLAILDVLDGLFCGNLVCETTETNATCAADCPGAAGTAQIGCGNQVAVNNTATTNIGAYGTLAGMLADDRLYVDTSKTICAFYLAVEFGVVTAVGGVPSNTTCGGRAPAYDVIDFTYSALSAGLGGFTAPPAFMPKIGDGVTAHTDLLTTFPYLGAPH